MTPYRIVAIPEKVANLVRENRLSPGYRHPAHAELATGYGPCRLCLRTFAVGVERRILFTYDPFFGLEPLPLPGPIFVHEEACERFPEDGGFPADLRSHALTLVGYGAGRRWLAEEHVADGVVEPVIERFLARPDIAYVHVRDTEAGCFDLRIERAAG